jgi:hypothetical protein
VPGLIEAAAGSDWTYGASILTFLFPELLFIAVAGALYVVYTKPHLVPGHRYQVQVRPPVTGTTAAGGPGQSPATPAPPAAPAAPAAGGQAAGDAEG